MPRTRSRNATAYVTETPRANMMAGFAIPASNGTLKSSFSPIPRYLVPAAPLSAQWSAEAQRMKKIVILVLLCSVAGLAQLARPAVYIEPQNGFETYLAAAISKKNVPVDVVTDQTYRDEFEQDAVGLLGKQTERRGQERAINGGSRCQASQRIRRAQVISPAESNFSEADG